MSEMTTRDDAEAIGDLWKRLEETATSRGWHFAGVKKDPQWWTGKPWTATAWAYSRRSLNGHYRFRRGTGPDPAAAMLALLARLETD